MKTERAVALAALMALGVGCGGSSSDGYAVDLTITVDTTLAQELATLTLSVTGAETFTSPAINVAGKLSSGRAGLRYQPGVSSGVLNFAVTARNASGQELAYGTAPNVTLIPGGTQKATIALTSATGDMGLPDMAVDLATPEDGARRPDLRPVGDLCRVLTVIDCDDGNPCTVDSVSDDSCGNTCTHTPQATAIACGPSPSPGVCLGSACCTGCIADGVCQPGTSNAKACGQGGASCFDCTQNSASATCNDGNCSGCDSTSCGARVCGTSSCGFNCGSCSDQCVSGGTLNHFVCTAAGTCSENGGGNCGLYATCASGSACATTCAGDSDCIASAFCNTSGKCQSKGGLGMSCTAEGAAHDRECQTNLHCTWYSADGDTLSAVCARNTCSGCLAISSSDWSTCTAYSGIPILLDPRGACPKTDACHIGCVGLGTGEGTNTPGTCNTGFDLNGNPNPCSPVTCADPTNDGNAYQVGGFCQKTGATTVSCVSNPRSYCNVDGDSRECCSCGNATDCSCSPC